MKNFKITFGFVLIALLTLTSCEHSVQMKTDVHEDGSLDKTIMLTSKEKQLEKNNGLGIGSKSEWRVLIDSVSENGTNKDSTKQENKYHYIFKKSFSSAERSNSELATPSDSLFRITSKFEKQFRWFYTYYSYSDTYHAINRFTLSVDDYLTAADFQFIQNLPAEGKPISKADSLFLNKLNERIFDDYGGRAYFEDYFQVLVDLASPSQKQNLLTQREAIFQSLNKKKDVKDDFLLTLADSLGIHVDEKSVDYKKRKKEVENKFEFISWATEGKYEHIIAMPGKLVSHNADSVSGSEFYWSPPYLKFAFRDYTMYAKTRKPNLWAWSISIAILVGAAWGLRATATRSHLKNTTSSRT
jgi:hypothetical protein